MLRIEGLKKSYAGTLAVDCIHFELAPGQVLGLLGPNGAGKTTTLGMIGGLLVPDAGDAKICGHSILSDSIAAKRELGFLADPPALLEGATGWENLEFIAEVFGVPKVREKAEPHLRDFQLADRMKERVGSLSKGMRQKLALTMVFLHDPKVILLDEPTTGLDPVGIVALNARIRSAAEGGACVAVSSHLLSILEGICGRVLLLKNGRLLREGTIGDLRASVAPGATLEQIYLDVVQGAKGA